MPSKEDRRRARADEARRRAGAVGRYVDIDRPTIEDDEALATELGLSVDGSVRLAAAWRRHRDDALLVGRKNALAKGAAPREEIMAATIDLAQVRPDRRDEILRRIRIVQRHLAAGERADAEANATLMGIGKAYFRAIVKTWMLTARAETLPGATTRRTPWRRQPARAARSDLLRSVVAAAKPGESVRKTYDAFVAACRRKEIEPLSLQRFYAIVQDLRARDGDADPSE